MHNPRVLMGWPLLVVLLSPCATSSADNSNNSNSPSIASQSNDSQNLRSPSAQPGEASSRTLPGSQPNASTTLEVAPQPSGKGPAADGRETDEQRALRQHQAEIARLNSNFHSRDLEDAHHRPYFGFDLEYTTQCYLGMEEHGFEVVTVYPNSPAARAGLIARTSSTPKGDLGALGSVLLGPVALVTFPLLRASGALGTPGDLIVAVDDVRVHTKQEFLHQIGKLKPGDTTYITVIRALQGGYHRTMRIAVHVDNETDATGNIIPRIGKSASGATAIESAAN
jgi:hypothetical protein